MLRLIARRLATLLPTLLLVSVGIFLLTAAIPGDAAQTLAGGERATPEQVDAVRDRLHLDEPLVSQYARWAGDAARLDFGTSLYSGEPVGQELWDKFPVTVALAVAAAVVGLVLGIPLGLASGLRAGGWLDGGARMLAGAAVAVPPFLVATLTVLLFSVRLGWLPTSGYTSPGASLTDWMRQMALPAFALGLGAAATVARQLRSAMVDCMASSYVRAAWARGCSPARVVVVHALRNAAIPALSAFGVAIAVLLGGSVIIEQIFGIPGMGLHMLRSITRQDVPSIQGIAMVYVVTTVALTLVLDVAFGLLNPKARVDR